MKITLWINCFLFLSFVLCSFYQVLYIPLSFVKKKEEKTEERLHHYAVLICARNEANVIAQLLCSLKNQTYPAEYLDVFVLADNCTDGTGVIARQNGATVYYRYNKQQVGKGFALEELIDRIHIDHPEGYDGYFVFDADNVLKKDYIEQMNRCYCKGNNIITSYRAGKNVDYNWISFSYSLWFARQNRFLNLPRDLFSVSCAVSGTGFFFSNSILSKMDGWSYHLLTEDYEFSCDQVLRGEKIAYCKEAIIYDEQPEDIIISFRQRLRWARGYLQVFSRYGKHLFKRAVSLDFSCYDLLMCSIPAFFISCISVLYNLVLLVLTYLFSVDTGISIISVLSLLLKSYLVVLILGGITLWSEWKMMGKNGKKKICYLFLFPFFMASYLPICICAFFCDCGWKEIPHKAEMREDIV